MEKLKNYGCVTVLLLGAVAFSFSVALERWGNNNPLEQGIEGTLMALTATLGGIWLTLFPKAWVGANQRLARVFIPNARSRPGEVFFMRLGGILMTAGGILTLVLSIQETLISLGIVGQP